MTMFAYLKYLANTLFRSTFFYLSTICTILVTTFLLFGLPFILKTGLNVIMNYIYFFILIMLFQVFNVANITTIIFRQSIDDGTELILQTKPMKKTTLIYMKILLFLFMVIVLSVVNIIITSFVIIYPYGGLEIGHKLIINMFTGTLIVYLLFGSIGILLSIFFKQLTTMMVVVGTFLLLMIYSIISNQIFMSIPKYLRKKENVYLSPISLVYKNQNDLLYSGGVAASFNSSKNYITKEIYSKLDGNNPSNTSDYLSYKWNKVIRQNSFIPYLYTNFVYQLATIYTQVPDSYLEQPFSSLEYWIRSSNSFNLSLEFIRSNPEQYLNAIINNVSYTLTNESQMVFTNINGDILTKNIINAKNNGLLNYFNETTKLPIDEINNNVNFLDLNYSRESLQLFIDKYLNNNQINLINLLDRIFVQNTGEKINPLSYYTSLFNYLNLKNYINLGEISENKDAYKESNNLKKILDSSSRQIMKFQYLSFEILKNKQDFNLTNEQINLLVNILGISLQDSISNFIISIIELPNISQTPIQNFELYISTPFFKLLESNYLTTFNFVKVNTFYNYNALIISWFTLSIVVLFIATICYFKHDFY